MNRVHRLQLYFVCEPICLLCARDTPSLQPCTTVGTLAPQIVALTAPGLAAMGHPTAGMCSHVLFPVYRTWKFHERQAGSPSHSAWHSVAV